MTHTILLVPQYWARRASSFLVAAAASLPASAFAADLAVPPPAFTWTGFYLGANAGSVLSPGNPAFQSQGFGSSAFDLPANGDGAKAGFTGGFQAGYNYQIGRGQAEAGKGPDVRGHQRGRSSAACRES